AARAHDAPRDGEAETAALRTLRREERLEDPRAHLGRHADPGVLDLHGRRPTHGGESERAAAARRHRLERVVEQVREDLAQLVGVTGDFRRVALDADLVLHATPLGLVLPAHVRELHALAAHLAARHVPRRAGAASTGEVLDAAHGRGAIDRGAVHRLEAE